MEMKMTSQTTTSLSKRLCPEEVRLLAFTLIELMVVLVIISAMMAVVLPYAAESNKSIELRNQCLSLAQAVRYIQQVAEQTGRVTRIIVNPVEGSYYLQIASVGGGTEFEPLEEIYPNPNSIGRAVRFTDIEGFDTFSRQYYLLFDPARPWPKAQIHLATIQHTKVIVIDGKTVEIENERM